MARVLEGESQAAPSTHQPRRNLFRNTFMRGLGLRSIALRYVGGGRLDPMDTDASKTRSKTASVKCRQIQHADAAAVASLLSTSFPIHSRTVFLKALDRLESRTQPDGFPKYGYLLESDGNVIGALLAIASASGVGIGAAIKCNVSCWCVVPGLQAYAPMLLSRIPRTPASTIVNISPHVDTWETIEAQGFQRFSQGQFAAILALVPNRRRVMAHIFSPTAEAGKHMTPAERTLLIDHASFGCISMVCTADDITYPFVFRIQKRRFLPPCARLIYCRDIRDVTHCAGAIGRFLALKGALWLLAATNGPLEGIPGIYVSNRTPMYFKGPNIPRIGDLSYTEAALFGF